MPDDCEAGMSVPCLICGAPRLQPCAPTCTTRRGKVGAVAGRRGDSRDFIPEPRKVYGGLLAPDDPPLSDTNIKTLRAHAAEHAAEQEHRHAAEYSPAELARLLDAFDIACAEIAQTKASRESMPSGSAYPYLSRSDADELAAFRAKRAGEAFDAGGAFVALVKRVEALEQRGRGSHVHALRALAEAGGPLPRPTDADLKRWSQHAEDLPGPLGRMVRILIAEVERLAAVLHAEQAQRACCGNCAGCDRCERLCPSRAEHDLPQGPCVEIMRGTTDTTAHCTWCSRVMRKD